MLFSSRVSAVFHKIRRLFGPRESAQGGVLIHGMNYAPEMIGVGKYTTELAVFLAEQGLAIEVVAALPHYPTWRIAAGWPRRWSVRRDKGVRVTRCPLVVRPGRIGRLLAPLSFAVSAAPVVVWRALRTRPRTVLCIEPTLFAAPAALLAARLVGARTVLHVQDLEADAAFATGYLACARPLLWAARRFESAMRRRFDAVVTISDAMAARLRQQGAAVEPVVLRNWVRDEAAPTPEAVASLRQSLGLRQGRRLVLYAGNLGMKQGLPVLIEAARHLRADPSIRILVVGDGAMATPVRAAAAGLPNMTWVGLLPAPQFGALLAAADLHVLPQDRRASDLVFPSKLGALLRSGKPILVTADPCSELARWLGPAAARCRPGDGRSLAGAIAAVLDGTAPQHDPEKAGDLLASLRASLVLPAFARHIVAGAWGPRERGRAAAAVHPRPALPAALA